MFIFLCTTLLFTIHILFLIRIKLESRQSSCKFNLVMVKTQVKSTSTLYLQLSISPDNSYHQNTIIIMTINMPSNMDIYQYLPKKTYKINSTSHLSHHSISKKVRHIKFCLRWDKTHGFETQFHGAVNANQYLLNIIACVTHPYR